MNFPYSVVFVFISLHYVISAPVDKNAEKSMYDAIIEKCPRVKSVPNYENQTLFQSCKDWKAISEVNKLTPDNHDQIRCLLYFETFTSYCMRFETLNLTIPKDILMGYDISMICSYAKTVPHKNLNTIFATEGNCQSVCSDMMGYINSVCSVSYYLGNTKKEEQSLQTKDKPQNVAVPQLDSTSKVLKGDASNSGATTQNVKTNDVQEPGPHAVQGVESRANGGNIENSVDTDVILPPQQEVPVPVVAAVPQPSNENHSQNSNIHNQEVINPPANAPAAPAVGDKPGAQSQDAKIDTQSEVIPAEVITPSGNEDKQENVPELAQNPQKSGGDDNIQEEIPIESNHNLGDLEMVDDGQEPASQEEVMDTSQNSPQGEKSSKPGESDDDTAGPVNYDTEMEGDSYFFTYFMILCIIFIAGYVCYHNKQKILALILEGRRGKRQYRGRRPNSANYHKLDSNLEEAINSSCKKNTNNVIY